MMIDYLNGILGPFLMLPSLWALVLLSLLITLFATLAYKWMTDQHLMKTLKEDIKKFQEEMKQFKEDPKKVLEIQKRAMETNMKYMMHSMKPMIITFIPFILMFTWLNANMAYEPIKPGIEFTTTAEFEKGTTGEITIITPEEIELSSEETQKISNGITQWKMKGEAGEYILEYEYEDETYMQELLITETQKYKTPETIIKNSNLKKLLINNNKKTYIFGIGWLGTYIILSVVFNMALRKLFKLH